MFSQIKLWVLFEQSVFVFFKDKVVMKKIVDKFYIKLTWCNVKSFCLMCIHLSKLLSQICFKIIIDWINIWDQSSLYGVPQLPEPGGGGTQAPPIFFEEKNLPI